VKKNKSINFKLYLITNRKLVTHYPSLITAVREALKGGVRAIQLREKDLVTNELIQLAYKLRTLTSRYKARFFVNDRFDIALAVGADGVHLTQNSIPVYAVKKSVRNKLLIGASTHSLKEAKQAELEGADFITIGPVYRTPSKLKYGKPLGISTLEKVSKNITIPAFAIGGIKSSRIMDVKRTGAYGVAMISEILKAKDVRKKTKEIVDILNKYE
jgi:thiamine-phosphate pyrophosphorylase